MLTRASSNYGTQRLWINEYRVLHTLGRGRFAKVALCERIDGELFAMKIFRISLLCRQRHWDDEHGEFRDAVDDVAREVDLAFLHYCLRRLHPKILGSDCHTLEGCGSIPHALCRSGRAQVRIGQPSGLTVVEAKMSTVDGVLHAESASVVRTQRRLFSGYVYVPARTTPNLDQLTFAAE